MALKATIYKAAVNVSDMDRNVFLDNNLTLARHPSETEERLMLRLLAWMKYADERLEFTRGLCADEEPELWLRNDHLGVDLWIELGLPDEKRLKKACSQATEVVLFTYNGRAASVWWQQNQQRLNHYTNLTIWYLDNEQMAQLVSLARRSMTLQAALQEGIIWLSDEQHSLEMTFEPWQVRQ